MSKVIVTLQSKQKLISSSLFVPNIKMLPQGFPEISPSQEKDRHRQPEHIMRPAMAVTGANAKNKQTQKHLGIPATHTLLMTTVCVFVEMWEDKERIKNPPCLFWHPAYLTMNSVHFAGTKIASFHIHVGHSKYSGFYHNETTKKTSSKSGPECSAFTSKISVQNVSSLPACFQCEQTAPKAKQNKIQKYLAKLFRVFHVVNKHN